MITVGSGCKIGEMAVIFTNEDFNIETLRNSQSGRFGVISFLLRAVGAQAKDSLVTIRQRDTINERPHMPKTTRGELDTRGQTQLWMSRKFRISFAIMKQMLCGNRALKGGQNILGCNSVTYELIRSFVTFR